MKKVLTSAIVGITLGATAIAQTANSGTDYFSQQEKLYKQLITIESQSEVECLALNIYFETRAVSLADAMAVSDVVMNRVESTNYPNTACDVVHDGYKPGRRDCQFSWYCDGKADRPTNSEAWERSRKYAHQFYYYGLYKGITEGSTHYHANYVSPYWAPTLDRITRIGSHIFYRMK